MPILSLTWETFWRTNVIRGNLLSGVNVQNDSGYVKMYSIHGILGSVLFYSVYLYIIIKPLKRMNKASRNFLVLCIVLMLVAEYKEEFILSLYFPFML